MLELYFAILLIPSSWKPCNLQSLESHNQNPTYGNSYTSLRWWLVESHHSEGRIPRRAKDIEGLGEDIIVDETGVGGEHTHQKNNVATSKDCSKHLMRCGEGEGEKGVIAKNIKNFIGALPIAPWSSYICVHMWGHTHTHYTPSHLDVFSYMYTYMGSVTQCILHKNTYSDSITYMYTYSNITNLQLQCKLHPQPWPYM